MSDGPATPRPDPLERLSDYEKTLILTMAPSWSERWRMRNKRLNSAERESLLLDILVERRRLYERCFKHACATAGIEPPTVRNVMEPERLKRYQGLMNGALSRTADQRREDDHNDWSLRQAAENRRLEQSGQRIPTNEEYQDAYEKRRAKRRGLRF